MMSGICQIYFSKSSEDDEIAEGFSAEGFHALHNPSEEYLKVLKGALEYQGFNPKAILKEMMRRRKSFLDMKRNNHISKIIKKSVPGVAAILEHLQEKYEIDDEVKKSETALGIKNVTFPRIAGVMPAVAVKMFHLRVVEETVPFLTIPGVKYEDADLEGGRTSSGIFNGQLIGPFELPDRLNGEAYLEFLRNDLHVLLEDKDLETDGSAAEGPLHPIDLFVWGYYKEIVYAKNISNVAELRRKLRQEEKTIKNNRIAFIRLKENFL
ncbi:unnamed protein product [Euphydryas editha]|uniref:Uncharacterized protein n=1 Tax=Euphydryas editha TaxID=104508 RepID=A0AAU9UQF9_EUPED|nr:unnamed protein product [Euphydryas editha]